MVTGALLMVLPLWSWMTRLPAGLRLLLPVLVIWTSITERSAVVLWLAVPRVKAGSSGPGTRMDTATAWRTIWFRTTDPEPWTGTSFSRIRLLMYSPGAVPAGTDTVKVRMLA